MNRHLSKEDIKWHISIQKYSIAFVTMELQTKAEIQKIGNTNCWQCFRAIRTLLCCWWECKMVHSLGKNIWQFLIKLNVVLLYNPAFSFLGDYSTDFKIYVPPKICIHFFFLFNWRIIALQYCVCFYHTSTWVSCMHAYVPSLLNFPPTSHPIPPL